MGKGLRYSRERADAGVSPSNKQYIRLAGTALVVTDVSDQAGWGTVVIGDFPEGNILFLGAVADLQFTKGDANIIDAFDGDFALGSAPSTGNGALTATLGNLIPSTAMVQGSSGVSAANRGVNGQTLSGVVLDNTDGSLEMNLNVLVDDAAITDDSSFAVDGAIYIAFVVLGDD